MMIGIWTTNRPTARILNWSRSQESTVISWRCSWSSSTMIPRARTQFDYYYHLVPHHPTMAPNLLEMLRVADFLDMKKVPRMLVNLFNWDPFIQYALAAYLNDKDLAVRMSEGLVCRGSSVDGIRHTAKVFLQEHASEYFPPLLKFWGARERDWAFFHSELLRGRLYHTSEHARQRCRSHGNMSGGAGLRDSDYAPWRREISDKIAKRPGLIDHPHKSIKDIVKRTMRCGYHPCIQPLEELLDRLKSMVWARMAKRINGDDIGPDDIKTEAKSLGPSGGSPMTARAVAPAISGDEHALSAPDGRDEDDEDQDEDEADDEEEAEQADDNPYKYEKAWLKIPHGSDHEAGRFYIQDSEDEDEMYGYYY